jgi:hypothetical protein
MVNNPQFPHYIKITRTETGDPFEDTPIEIPVFESVCQIQMNEVGDTVWKEKVLYSDYTAYCPFPNGNREDSPEIKKDCFVEANDCIRDIYGRVSQSEAGNLGIRIFFNESAK